MDLLRFRQNTQREIRECCALILTETWLQNNIPDSAVQLDGLICLRADRTSMSRRIKGGRPCVYVNTGWCMNTQIINSYCSIKLGYLLIKCLPHYLLREFTFIIIAAVYIPPSVNIKDTLEELNNAISCAQNSHPEGFFIIAGDFNQANLRDILPKFHQYITLPTRTHWTMFTLT